MNVFEIAIGKFVSPFGVLWVSIVDSEMPFCIFAESVQTDKLVSSSVGGRCSLHAPLPSVMKCPCLMSCTAKAKASSLSLRCARGSASVVPTAKSRIATVIEQAQRRFRMIAFMASDEKVCLRPRSGKQYSLHRAVAQLASAVAAATGRQDDGRILSPSVSLFGFFRIDHECFSALAV